MANVMFKRGLQSQLPQTAQDGVFYLTTDSNRLYIGNSGGKMSLLNQTVQIVTNVAALPLNPETNDFYYCEQENILAVWNGGSEWIQINKDTNDIVQVTGVTQGDYRKEGDVLVYPLTISQSKTTKDGKLINLDDIGFEIRISKSDLEEVIFKPANVGLTRTVDGNKATIATNGDGSNSSATVTIAGGDNIAITSENSNTIKISAQDTTYDLLTKTGSTEGVLCLKDGDGAEDEIKFLAGKDLVASSDDKNNITYSHSEIGLTLDSVSSNDLKFGDSITVVRDIQTDNGHVTKITTATAKIPELPDDIHIKEIINEKDGEGNVVSDWKVQIKETSIGATFDIDFSEDAKQLKKELQDEISEGLAAANTALVYKGGIDAYSALPTANVEIGDTYLLTKESGSYKVGDLFIATVKAGGTHDKGVINSDSIEWTHVPSGDELNTDTYFKGDVTISADENKVTFEVVAAADADGNITTVAGNEALVIKGGTDIVISSDSGAKISHSTYNTPTSTTTAAESDTTFTAITGITTNNGHITEIKKETFDILEYELIGSDNKIILKDSNGVENEYVEVAGDNWIGATVANDKLEVKHKNTSGSGKTVDTANASTTLSADGKFKIISKVAYDDAGHITEVASQELTMPEDKNTEYDLFVSDKDDSTATAIATGTVANPYIVLKDNDGVVNPIQISSTSLSINGEKEKIAIDLVWGSFQ